MSYQIVELDNKAKVLLYPLESTLALTLLVLIKTGSKAETKEQNGISHLVEHMAFKGTKKRPSPLLISQELDSTGGIYNAFTSKEFTGFWIKVKSSNLEKALDLISDVIFNPLLEEEELEKEKLVILEEMRMYKDIPQEHVEDLFEELLFGDQPSGWPVIGREESLKALKREDLLKYINSQFKGPNSLIVLTGNFDKDKALELVKDYFQFFDSSLPRFNLRSPQSLTLGPAQKIEFKETEQVHLALGVRAFSMFEEKKYPLVLLALILGGLMSSRLFVEIREKRGLAYYISTQTQLYTDSGYLLTQAGVSLDKVEEALKVILEEHLRMTKEEVLDEELERAKEALKGRLALSLETSESWAKYLGVQQLLRGEVLMPHQEYAKIDKVQKGEILELAKELFLPQNFYLALIGKVEKLKLEDFF